MQSRKLTHDLLLQKALQVHSHSPPTPTSEPNVIEEEDRSEIRQGCRERLQRLSSLRQKKGGDDDRCHWTTDSVRQVWGRDAKNLRFQGSWCPPEADKSREENRMFGKHLFVSMSCYSGICKQRGMKSITQYTYTKYSQRDGDHDYYFWWPI